MPITENEMLFQRWRNIIVDADNQAMDTCHEIDTRTWTQQQRLKMMRMLEWAGMIAVQFTNKGYISYVIPWNEPELQVLNWKIELIKNGPNIVRGDFMQKLNNKGE